MKAHELRRAFTGYFEERGHKLYSSIGLIPLHPRAPMFANAGMNQFLPVFLGEEPAPEPPRGTSVQKCVRIQGKHDDIENIGRTWGHLTFFEMLGNFSFGDYFKAQAIEYGWDFSTRVCGLDGDRIWVTVHTTDDEAEAIWREKIGVPAERIRRFGEDNFWEMGDTGPCGPCSELYYDMGPAFGDETGVVEEYNARYREFLTLVFMQNYRHPDGSLTDLPKKNIDTGMGLERMLTAINGDDNAFDTDELHELVVAASRLTGRPYRDGDDAVDVSLRILADHSRTVTFLVNDGVYPSNEDRGYVLRRLLRRAVRHAFQLGVDKMVLPEMIAAVTDVMSTQYPELQTQVDFITGVVQREEERFRETLATGSTILDEALESGDKQITGEVAFKLHDTFGFPIELTREIAEERGVGIDIEGFNAAMAAQRTRARESRKAATSDDAAATRYRELVEQFGPTDFTGYVEEESRARVLAVEPSADGRLEVFLDRTPFYAEGGGQVGDTGSITTESGSFVVVDTTAPIAGLHRHVVEMVDGQVVPGQAAVASVDNGRRGSIRRNHTGTHLLHWALREVLGGHVKQQGSLVNADYLRFDFSHHAGVKPEELAYVQELVNAEVLANEAVRSYETTKAHADESGVISFFDEKYGEYVRVVEAGEHSRELCGGTHVGALGSIGTIQVISEASIGSNIRRIFALTGAGSLARVREREAILRQAAELLKTQPDDLPAAVARLQDAQRALQDEVKLLRGQAARGRAGELAAAAVDGIVVARVDDVLAEQLRELAVGIRDQPNIRGTVLMGSPDGERVAVIAAVRADSGLPDAPALVREATGGKGGGKDPTLAQGGGREIGEIDAGLDRVRRLLNIT
jgi:alanyl-tRNA synthetase